MYWIKTFILFLGFVNSFAATYYVSTKGDDNNPGTEAKPFKTLQRANEAVSAGDTVIVEDGTYSTGTTGEYNAILEITKAGNASNWITFKARNKHKAILDGVNYKDFFLIVKFARTSAFVRLDGFSIKRSRHTAVRAVSRTTSGEFAHDIEIINNRIYDIGKKVVNHTYGISGIKTDPLTRRVLIEGNIIYDIGRLPGGNYPDGASGHDYRHDHGWYAQGKGHTFKNNYVYNCKAGFGIKIDGHYANEELEVGEFTHVIENNFFKPEPQPTVGGWIRPYNNRKNNEIYGRMKDPRYILDGNYFFGDPGGLGYPVRITAHYSSSNFSGTVMRNNISSAAHLFEPNPDIIKNITTKNNTVNAPDSMFENWLKTLQAPTNFRVSF